MLSAPQGWCHERECIICDHCAPDISRHGRHGRDSHPVAFAANLPAGCKNYRAAPAGFPRCGTCNIYIGDAFVGKHFSNRRHIYLRGIAKQKESDFLISSPRTGPDTRTVGTTHQSDNSSHHGEDPRTPSISSAFNASPVPGDWLIRCDPLMFNKHDWVGEVVLSPIRITEQRNFALPANRDDLMARARNVTFYNRVRVLDIEVDATGHEAS